MKAKKSFSDAVQLSLQFGEGGKTSVVIMVKTKDGVKFILPQGVEWKEPVFIIPDSIGRPRKVDTEWVNSLTL